MVINPIPVGWVSNCKLIPACRFLFIGGVIFALNQKPNQNRVEQQKFEQKPISVSVYLHLTLKGQGGG